MQSSTSRQIPSAAARRYWALRTVLLTVASLLLVGATVASDLDEQQPIVIDAVSGDVQLSMQGQTRPATSGTTLQLPVSITTGGDGSIELRQGRTLIALAADTQMDIPIPSQPGEGLDRIIESRGNAFYSVAKRQLSRLHVDTPYMVAVVKGTQFNVAAQADRTTIALFEGQLEVRTPGDTDIVELNSGEIAVHFGAEPSIRVLRMDSGQTLRGAVDTVRPGSALLGGTGIAGVNVLQPASSATSAASGTATGITTTAPLEPVGSAIVGANSAGVSSAVTGTGSGTTNIAATPGSSGASTTILAGVGLGSGSSTGAGVANVGVGITAGGTGTLGVGVNTNAGIGSGGLSTGAGVGASLGGSGLAANTSVSASLGGSGLSANTSVGASLGGSGLSANTSVGASLGGSGLSANTSVGASLGGSAGVNAGGSVSVTGSGLSVTTGAGLNVGGASASVGVSTGSTSPITVGISLGSTNVTLGSGAASPSTVPTTVTTPTSAPAGSGGLLGGVTNTLGGIVNGVLGGSKPGHP